MLIAFCIISVAGVLVATTNGPGIDHDAVHYMSTGLNLGEGYGLETFEGLAYDQYAPGLPFIIAAGTFLGIDVDLIVRLLNACSLAVVVVLAYFLLRRHIDSRIFVLGGTAFIAVNTSLLAIADMAWSEPPFVAVALAFVVALEGVIAKPTRWANLVCAIVLAWAGFLIRYSGLALIPIGIAVCLLGLWKTDRRVALQQAGIFTVGALAVPFAWMLRNKAVNGAFLASRPPSPDSPQTNIYRILTTVGDWLFPGRLINWGVVTEPVLASLGGALLLLTALAFWRTRSASSGSGHQCPSAGDHYSMVPLVALIVGYAGFSFVAASTVLLDPLDSRLLSPTYPPLVVIVFVAADQLWSKYGDSSRGVLAVVARGLLITILVVGLALQLWYFIAVARRDSLGVRYASPQWRDSELVAIVSQLPDSAVLYSNQPGVLWAVVRHEPRQERREPLRYSPRFRKGRSNVADSVPPSFLQSVACQTTFLVWFTNSKFDFLMSPTQLESFVNLELAGKGSDGELYRLHPKSGDEQTPACSNIRG